MKHAFFIIVCLVGCSSPGASVARVDANQACFDDECFQRTSDPRTGNGPRVFLDDCGDLVKQCTTNTNASLKDVVFVLTKTCESGYAKVWECDKNASGLQLQCYCP